MEVELSYRRFAFLKISEESDHSGSSSCIPNAHSAYHECNRDFSPTDNSFAGADKPDATWENDRV